MRKSKIIISLMLIVAILSGTLESLAASFDLAVNFDGKNITMTSETTDMSWNLNNFLPGDSDTSTVTIRNSGNRTATVETGIKIENDNGLLDKITLTVKNSANETVFTGAYTELTTISKTLAAGATETYTVATSLATDAGNEYQNKQYKLKFTFKAIGTIPMGTVTVKYVDENGTDIEPATVDTKKINAAPMVMPKTGKAIEGYKWDYTDLNGTRLTESNGNVNLEYTEAGTVLTYHYNKIKYGKLAVKYVADNELVEGEPKVLDADPVQTKEVGTAYQLPTTGKAITGYRFDRVEGDTTGTYIEGTKTVIYHYNKIKYGQLVVKYVSDTENGKLLEGEQDTTKEVGTEYSLPAVGKDFTGYRFDRVEGEISGRYIEGTITVIYHYKKILYGTVTVKHVSDDEQENGQPKVLVQEFTRDEVDKPYNVAATPKTIEGYSFNGRIDGELSGRYINGNIDIVFHYNKRKMGKLVIKCVDKDSGAIIKQTTTYDAEVGTPYQYPAEGEPIDGYRFDSVEGQLSGVYKEGTITIIYYYKKIDIKVGRLIVKYVDENNTEIADQVITTKTVGTPYELDPMGMEIEGYDFVGIEGDNIGEYKEEDTIVLYRYNKKKTGRVIILYVDEEENEIGRTVTTKTVGETYEYTEDEIKKEITGYEYVRTDGELTGKYKEEDTIIYCRYEKIKSGRLIVLCVDENNQVIKQTITTKRVGTDYSLSDVGEEIPGYRFLSVEGETTGKYKVKDTVVKYKYKKIREGNVIVLYVDENEKEIERKKTTDEVDTSYSFTEDEIKKDIPSGYKFIKTEGELTGKYKEEDTIIYCRCEKIKHGRLIVLCIDENNKVIKRTITVEEVGTEYNLGKVGEEIEGYDFVGVEGETSGKYKEEDTIVTYRYKSKKPQGVETEEIKLPETGQFIYLYVILGLFILLLFLLLFLFKRKNKNDEENKDTKKDTKKETKQPKKK